MKLWIDNIHLSRSKENMAALQSYTNSLSQFWSTMWRIACIIYANSKSYIVIGVESCIIMCRIIFSLSCRMRIIRPSRRTQLTGDLGNLGHFHWTAQSVIKFIKGCPHLVSHTMQKCKTCHSDQITTVLEGGLTL